MKGNALYVPCYPGELGWELVNYVPYVNRLANSKSYSEIHIVTRIGREALYPMGTHFYPIELSSSKSMGNSGPKLPANNIVKDLNKRFATVDQASTPPGGCRYIKGRKFIAYQSTEEALWKWRHIPENSVVLSVRGRNFGTHKNWPGKNWHELCNHLLSRGYTPVISGIKELVDFDLPKGAVDVRNKTTLGDLIAIMQKSRFVIGQSSGPMHLASMSTVPHAVWGSSRLKERYAKSWNPHRTIVEYYICPGGKFNCPLESALKLADRIISRVQS